MDGFLMIPNDIRYSAELGAAEKLLLAEVQTWAGDDGWSDVTTAHLAQMLGVSVRRIKQMVASLAATGWMETDRQANRRRLKVTPKALPEGEINFTVKNISPQRMKEISPSTVKNISPTIITGNNIKQPTIQPRACEVEEVEVVEAIDQSLEALAREFARGWTEQGRLIMHRAGADETLWPAVVLDTAQWLYLERSKLNPNEKITERDLRLAVTSPRCVKRAIKNIKDNNGESTTNRKADINSDAAVQERQREWVAEFARGAQPQDRRPAGTV